MTPTEFQDCLNALRWSQRGLAEILHTHQTTVRRWAAGQQAIPDNVARWLWELAIYHRRKPHPDDWYLSHPSGSGALMFDDNNQPMLRDTSLAR